jgi:acetyltransferase-like isoleucine patch superfamily enzyme
MRYLLFKILNKLFYFWIFEKLKAQKNSLKSCGKNVQIDKNATLWGVDAISVADDVTINGNTFIFGSGGVSIGNRVEISANCVITSVTHFKQIERRKNLIFESVIIEDDVWIGAGVVILPGVVIGRGSIIGAGSVVTKDVIEKTIVFGESAKIRSSISE